ncbi:MAG: hypothetical protein GIX03_03645 [Candidatus Eremiobacteraeota bacterium]|nr:hypothetical protein [Candidatus Eremiobacteraeota bacterium]MBC5802107.1 hypothetical protein [Candidatus Eremiobacteraeota bacterium]
MLSTFFLAVALAGPARPTAPPRRATAQPRPATQARPATPGPAVSGGHCLDSFLAAGQPIAPPADVSRGVQHTRPDRVIRVDIVQAKTLPGDPMVGFLYITEQGSVLFSTRQQKNVEPRVVPLIREIFAAASTATASQLLHLLQHQNGNAVLYLRHPMFLKRLPLRALPCVVLSRNAR